MSERMLTIGVEEEFLLVDREGQVASRGWEVADGAPAGAGRITQELMRCQVESATGVCSSAEEVVADLTALRTRLAVQAGRQDLRLLPSGTAPLGVNGGPLLTRDARYEQIAREFGELARACLTCACHVHIGIPDRVSGLAISNQLRRWLPVLLALTANSPLHEDMDTQYASWRHVLWSRWPSAGPPPHFESVDHYEFLVETLLHSGAILDRGMVYWDARLSEHEPTLEIRISDVAASVEEAGLLAALVRALAARALQAPDPIGVLPHEMLRARLWRAAHDGLSGRGIDPLTGSVAPAWSLVDSLVDHVRPQLRESGDEDFALRALARLRKTGGGAQRQRSALARRRRSADAVDALAWPVDQFRTPTPAGAPLSSVGSLLPGPS